MNARRLDVVERELAVVAILREHDRPLTVPEIHRRATTKGVAQPETGDTVADSVTVPVYYKLIRRLVATGRLVELEGEPVRYGVADNANSDTALSLDELEYFAAEVRPLEAIATLLEARQYVASRTGTVLKAAAEALKQVDPVELVEQTLRDMVEEFNADVALWDEHAGQDSRHNARVADGRDRLENLCYRHLGLPPSLVHVPLRSAMRRPVPATVHESTGTELRDILRRRVFGRRALNLVSPVGADVPSSWETVVVAGSDATTYPGAISVGHQAADESEMLTFNTGAVFVRMEGAMKDRFPVRVHALPVSGGALDDPAHAGTVMAPFMYRGLSPSEYEHMAKCATDVVQWRVDQQIFSGSGRARSSNAAFPAPRLHIRSGTVTLQEREINHYQRMNAYGEMVREGVRLSHQVVRRVADARGAPPVFAGSVRGAQLRLFTVLISAFIRRGARSQGIAPVDPSWDSRLAEHLGDNELMTTLMAALGSDGLTYWVSFTIVRPFHALTDLFRAEPDETGWAGLVKAKRASQMADPESDTWWKSIDGVEDDPFVRMLEEGDYAMFYVGHTLGDPPYLLPRYEFVDSLRALNAETAAERVERSIHLLVAGLHRVGFAYEVLPAPGRSARRTSVVPSVLATAREGCRAIGRRLEKEVLSMAVAQLKKRRENVDVEMSSRPMTLERFVSRLAPTPGAALGARTGDVGEHNGSEADGVDVPDRAVPEPRWEEGA